MRRPPSDSTQFTADAVRLGRHKSGLINVNKLWLRKMIIRARNHDGTWLWSQCGQRKPSVISLGASHTKRQPCVGSAQLVIIGLVHMHVGWCAVVKRQRQHS
jgi:hypothetical protein